MPCTKGLHKPIQKSCVPEFPILSAHKLSLFGLVVFIDINTYILTEGRNFKRFLKENYAIVLSSCYLFTYLLNVENGIERDIASAYGVCIHYTFLGFTADLMNTMQVKYVTL